MKIFRNIFFFACVLFFLWAVENEHLLSAVKNLDDSNAIKSMVAWLQKELKPVLVGNFITALFVSLYFSLVQQNKSKVEIKDALVETITRVFQYKNILEVGEVESVFKTSKQKITDVELTHLYSDLECNDGQYKIDETLIFTLQSESIYYAIVWSQELCKEILGKYSMFFDVFVCSDSYFSRVSHEQSTEQFSLGCLLGDGTINFYNKNIISNSNKKKILAGNNYLLNNIDGIKIIRCDIGANDNAKRFVQRKTYTLDKNDLRFFWFTDRMAFINKLTIDTINFNVENKQIVKFTPGHADDALPTLPHKYEYNYKRWFSDGHGYILHWTL